MGDSTAIGDFGGSLEDRGHLGLAVRVIVQQVSLNNFRAN